MFPWYVADEGRTEKSTGNEEAIGRVIEHLARGRRRACHAGDGAVKCIGRDGHTEKSGKCGGADEMWLCEARRNRRNE